MLLLLLQNCCNFGYFVRLKATVHSVISTLFKILGLFQIGESELNSFIEQLFVQVLYVMLKANLSLAVLTPTNVCYYQK